MVLSSVYYSAIAIVNFKKHDPKRIYMWGDSQVFRGVNTSTLNAVTNRSVSSYAFPGSGVYDFLVFTKDVPENSDVLVAFSIPVLMRKKKYDYSRSNITPDLITLVQHGYTKADLDKIIDKNGLKIHKVVDRQHELYNDIKPKKRAIPISVSDEVFKSIPTYFKSKTDLFRYGLNRLKKKNCTILMVQFPYNQEMEEILNNSPANNQLKQFKNQLISEFFEGETNAIPLINEENMMRDYTHLNRIGAQESAIALGKLMNNDLQKDQFVLLHIPTINNSDSSYVQTDTSNSN